MMMANKTKDEIPENGIAASDYLSNRGLFPCLPKLKQGKLGEFDTVMQTRDSRHSC